ncbi:amidohydrolase family protein [Gordonia sp. NPDC003376]
MTTLDGLIDGIVDTHVQQWNPRRSPRLGRRMSRVQRVVPRFGDRVFSVVSSQAEREYLLTPRLVARAYEPRQYSNDVAAVPAVCGVPIESVVVTDAYTPLDEDEYPADDHCAAEVDYLLGLPFGAAPAPRLGAMMVRGNPTLDGFADRLDTQLAVSDKIRGIQINASRHPDPKVRDGCQTDGLLATPAFLRGMEAVAGRGLAAEIFVYSHQLYDVVTVAREYPDTTIIVDHLGCPVGAFGPVGLRTGTTAAARADILRLWRERMTSLATQTNIVIKLSGLALPVLGYGSEPWGNIGARDTLTHMVGPLVKHVVAHFGSSRVMFGSNFPLDKPNASFEMVVGSLLDVLEPWGEHVLRSVFRETARKTYRIGD